jgi:ATP-dependent RNA helicase RhlE
MSKNITFADLGLSSPILKKLERQGYEHPTPIQAQAIPHILARKDVVGLAQTGTGKTAAFTLPILHTLGESDDEVTARPIRALIVTPTRELAVQIDKAVRSYGENLSTRSTCVVGGISLRRQIKPLKQGVDVLVATPGRLEDLISQRIVELDWVEIVVLDEADQMLDIGFLPAIKRILALTPKDRQTLLFSATMPKQIRELSNRYMKKPIEISVSPTSSTAKNVKQSVMFVSQPDKTKTAIELLKKHKGERTILFSRTKRGCDRIARRLSGNGLSAEAIHGNKSQNQRTRALEGFRAGNTDILVATDVAARGIDIPDVALVLNFDLPQVAEAYVHRIGRTGRAGKSGIAIAFCNDDETKMLRDIEKVIKQKIPVRALDGTVEAELSYDPVTNRKAERTYDHTKPRTHEAPEGKGKHRSRVEKKGSGEKRKPQNTSQNDKRKPRKAKTQNEGQKGNKPPTSQEDHKTKSRGSNRRNRPGSRARKRHRTERGQK